MDSGVDARKSVGFLGTGCLRVGANNQMRSESESLQLVSGAAHNSIGVVMVFNTIGRHPTGDGLGRAKGTYRMSRQ